MIHKFPFYLGFLLLLPLTLFSQTDKVLDSVMNQRSDIRVSFGDGDLTTTQYLKDDLIAWSENKSWYGLYPAERWLLDYWVQDYADLLTMIIKKDSAAPGLYMVKEYPPDDSLYQMLEDTTLAYSNYLFSLIDRDSSTNHEEKMFLRLHFLWCLSQCDYPVSQDSLNQESDAFMTQFPGSRFNNYIRQTIRYIEVKDEAAVGADLGIGFGNYSNGMQSNFSAMFLMNFGLDIYHNRWVYSGRFMIGFGQVNKDQHFGDNLVWEKGSVAQSYQFDLNIGRVVADLRKTKITPFAGLAFNSVGASSSDVDKYAYLKKAGLGYRYAWVFGVNFDYKLSQGLWENDETHQQGELYSFIRLRYEFNMLQFAAKHQGYDGYLHCITLGIGGFTRAIKRVY